MFLRSHRRMKDGKEHRYYSIEESRRLQSGRVVQRRVLYLGEINDSQQAAWRKTLAVFDEQQQGYTTLSLFPEDRPVPAEAVDSVQVKLSEMTLRRARPYGNCWLGCELWRQLELDQFWEQKLERGREEVSWAQVLELLVVNRLIDPGSEFRLHRQWFDQSAMDVLLGVDFAVAEKDRLYRCLDRILSHKADLFVHLQQRWKSLFDVACDVLLYDLTSTYVEGEAEQNPKAKRGYSRDGRPDCKQVIVALVITPEGFPLAYEVMDGNTSDKTTLRGFLTKIESLYGKARRVWLMDRGIPTEAVLQEMRAAERQMFYLVGTPKARVTKYEKQWLNLPWQKVRDSVEVKLFSQDGEMYVLAKSEGRQQKEIAIRRKKLARLLRKLRRMRKSLPKRDQLLLRIGAAKTEAGRAFGFVKIRVPGKDEEVTRETFTFHTDKVKLKEAQLRDGHYLLRTNMVAEDPTVLWDRYMQLTQIEAAFKCLKSELGIRPIYHQLEHRVEAHILVAFLAYCLSVTLKYRLHAHAPGLTSRAVLDKLAAIQMLDVSLPTTDGRCLTMPRYTEPEPDVALLLHQLKLTLPNQPPPRITALSGETLPPHLKM
ncbi:MAG TPA: IS1634 family transposase [Terriglobales bacterium]